MLIQVALMLTMMNSGEIAGLRVNFILLFASKVGMLGVFYYFSACTHVITVTLLFYWLTAPKTKLHNLLIIFHKIKVNVKDCYFHGSNS